MIDKTSEAINSFYSYLRAVLDNPDTIDPKRLEHEATNYLNRNPHVKDNIDFHTLVGGISERIDIRETINFGITLDDKNIDHKEWYEEYLKKIQIVLIGTDIITILCQPVFHLLL